jgi:hypothetical protein
MVNIIIFSLLWFIIWIFKGVFWVVKKLGTCQRKWKEKETTTTTCVEKGKWEKLVTFFGCKVVREILWRERVKVFSILIRWEKSLKKTEREDVADTWGAGILNEGHACAFSRLRRNVHPCYEARACGVRVCIKINNMYYCLHSLYCIDSLPL